MRQLSSHLSDEYWQGKIDPQLLSDEVPKRDEVGSARERDKFEDKRALREILAEGDEETGTQSEDAQKIAALDVLLPGISVYLSEDVEEKGKDEKGSESHESVLPRFSSPLPASSDSAIRHVDLRRVSACNLASSDMAQSNVESVRPRSGGVIKCRRPRTVRISSPGQNPQRMWEKKQRRDSVVENMEISDPKMEEDKITYEETVGEVVDHDKQRWEDFVSEAGGG